MGALLAAAPPRADLAPGRVCLCGGADCKRAHRAACGVWDLLGGEATHGSGVGWGQRESDPHCESRHTASTRLPRLPLLHAFPCSMTIACVAPAHPPPALPPLDLHVRPCAAAGRVERRGCGAAQLPRGTVQRPGHGVRRTRGTARGSAGPTARLRLRDAALLLPCSTLRLGCLGSVTEGTCGASRSGFCLSTQSFFSFCFHLVALASPPPPTASWALPCGSSARCCRWVATQSRSTTGWAEGKAEPRVGDEWLASGRSRCHTAWRSLPPPAAPASTPRAVPPHLPLVQLCSLATPCYYTVASLAVLVVTYLILFFLASNTIMPGGLFMCVCGCGVRAGNLAGNGL